ncbi:MAG TPA: hypothetical protein VK668_20180 [Mucilaginibacter sp.]|nr:hypothetical protein [Mucilaginibacter sp.]
MKNYIVMLVILATFTNCKQKPDKSKEMIEFIFTRHPTYGLKPVFPLIISKVKLDLPLNLSDYDKEFVKKTFGKTTLTEKEKDIYLNLKYDFIVTDDKNYQLLVDYILSHKNLYCEENKNPQNADDFRIVMDGDTYIILSTSIDTYREQLLNFLKANHARQNIIDEIKKL